MKTIVLYLILFGSLVLASCSEKHQTAQEANDCQTLVLNTVRMIDGEYVFSYGIKSDKNFLSIRWKDGTPYPVQDSIFIIRSVNKKDDGLYEITYGIKLDNYIKWLNEASETVVNDSMLAKAR